MGPKKKEEIKTDQAQIGPNETVAKIDDFANDFTKQWASRDEAKNFQQGYDIRMARADIEPDLRAKYNNDIDELIRMELENLRALASQKQKKGRRKQKKKKRKKQKAKNLKLPGWKYIKEMSPEDLIRDLVQNNFLKKLPPQNLSGFMGEFNYIHSMLDTVKDPIYDPSMALIRQLITEYIIFPLGSELVKMRNKEHLRSFLFYGPPGSGKTMAVRAICTEVNALLIDLSPHNIEGTYDGKRLEEKLVATAMVAAKAYQPSVVYIDEAEKVWPSKKGGKKGKKKRGGAKKASDATNPTRIKKPLLKWKTQKFFDDKTRVTIVGCTSFPEDGSKKDFKKFFEKQIYFPFPDYTTRRLMWKNFIERHEGKLGVDFPLSTLAHISAGYAAGAIHRTVKLVMSKHRVIRQDIRPLKIQEFVGPLSYCECTMNDTYAEYQIFSDWISGAEAERKKVKQALEDADDDAKKKGKKKK